MSARWEPRLHLAAMQWYRCLIGHLSRCLGGFLTTSSMSPRNSQLLTELADDSASSAGGGDVADPEVLAVLSGGDPS